MKKILLFFTCGFLFFNLKSQNTVNICAGNSATLQASNPQNLSSVSYSINPGGSSNSTGNFVVMPGTNTNYTLYTSGQNAANVAVTSSMVTNVIVYVQPSVAPTVIQASCSNSLSSFDLNLTFIPNNTNYAINWNPIPNGILINGQTSATAAITPGVYNVTVTATGGCSGTGSFTVNPQPANANFQLFPQGNTFTLNCYQPSLTLSVAPTTNSYTWTNTSSAPLTGTNVVCTTSNLGNWTVSALNPVSGCTATKTFTVNQNFSVPTSTVFPSILNMSCSQGFATTFSISGPPSANVQQNVYSPFGGTVSAATYSTTYVPGGPGTYTNCFTNIINGCSVYNTFTVTSNTGFPTYSITSLQNFTLGCNSKSVALIQITNASATNSLQMPTGGAVSYTILTPGASSTTASGVLSVISNYTVNSPGTYTVVTKDNVSMCENRTSVSVISNTIAPDISVLVPKQILDCTTSSVTLEGLSQTPNISYDWYFTGTPGTSSTYSISTNVNFSVPTQSLIDTYTLIVRDNNSTCMSSSIIPIYQNLFPPKANISNGGTNFITCATPSVILVNTSSTGIPSSTGFNIGAPVIGYLWEGPMPMSPLNNTSTYTALVPGVYTLTAMDMNNGCKSQTTIAVMDNIVYPQPNLQSFFFLPCPGTVELYATVAIPGPAMTYSWAGPANATMSSSNGQTITTNAPGYYTMTVTNTLNGCASMATTVVQACVGLGSISNENYSVTIFPNPNHGSFFIVSSALPKTTEIEIYNTLGELVKSVLIDSDAINIDMQNMASGIYFLKVTDHTKTLSTQKIIIE